MEVPPNAHIYSTALLDCWFGEDGILYSVSKPAERSIENFKALFEVYGKLCEMKNSRLCTLGDVSRTQPMPKEVREYISEELPKYIKAMALVSHTRMGL